MNPDYSTICKSRLETLNTEGYKSLLDHFAHATQEFSDRTAFATGDDSITFADINRRSRNLASYLSNHLKLAAGSRIAIQMPNHYHYAIATWAVLRAGMVIVNTNPLYTARELKHQFNDSGAVALIVADSLAESTSQVIDETGIKHVIIDRPCGANTAMQDAEKIGADYRFEDFIANMDTLAALQYTGGTTGLSKGAMLTHGNFFAAMTITREVFPVQDDDQEIVIAPMPVYHIYGFLMSMISTFLNGGMSALIPNPRNIDSVLAEMLRYRGSGLAGVNTLFQGMMAHPEFENVDFSRYVSVIAGGTALIKEISDEWRSKTGIDIQEGYGLSETASALTVNAPGARKLGSVGKILRSLDVVLLDADGNEVEKGQPGEISVRGPIVMQGYWNKADATREAITADGFFRTGDIGTVDDDGFITIVDRVKDMIIVSGFNVYPNEVESVVYGHPSVVECAAVGIKSDTTGEAIKLYVVSKDPALTTDDLISFCRQELTGYKVPKDIEFRSDLPKSNVGKILRRSLRDEANA